MSFERHATSVNSSATTELINNTEDRTMVDEENARSELDIQAQKYHQPRVTLGKVRLVLMMLGLSLGVLLAAPDQTTVSTELPAIASDFKTSDLISWVPISYLITATSFQPTYGRISDIFGRKATFLFAFIVFELGSLLSGLAPNMITLIIFRAIAGLGGAGIMSLVMTMITDVVSPQDHAKYQGLIGGAFGIAPVVGPLARNALTDYVNRRWASFINLPLGAIVMLAVIFLFHIPRPKGSLLQTLKRIDYLGIIVMNGSVMAILLALSSGGNVYEWRSLIITILFLVGNVGFGLFALIEMKLSFEPITPPYLFQKSSKLSGCFATNLLQGMVFFGLIYHVPLYFQVAKGDGVTESGLELIPYVLAIAVASIVTGQFMSRSDVLAYRTICAIGSVLITVGAGLIATWGEHSGRVLQIGYMVVAGLGVGVIMQTTLLYGQQVVKHEDIAVITSFLNFVRALGGVFGIAVFRMVHSMFLTRKLEKLSLPSDLIDNIKRSAMTVQLLPEDLKPAVVVAYLDALRIAFIVMIPVGVLCFLSTFMMANHKPKKEQIKGRIVTLE